MNENEIEENLKYGDCFNFFGTLSSVLVETVGTVKKTIEKTFDKNVKKD